MTAICAATRDAGGVQPPATAMNRAINSLGMLAMMAMPKKENTDPDKATFTNLTISNVPGPKQKLYFHGAEMDGMYPVSVLAGDHRVNITVLGYHEHLHFGIIGCPDTLPSVQKLAMLLPPALLELEQAFGRPARLAERARWPRADRRGVAELDHAQADERARRRAADDGVARDADAHRRPANPESRAASVRTTWPVCTSRR